METLNERADRNASDVLLEILSLLPLATIEDLYNAGSNLLKEIFDLPNIRQVLERRFNKQQLEFIGYRSGANEQTIAPKTFVTKSCPKHNSVDSCLRGASGQGSLELVDLFVTQGASDVSGALVKAAEAGSFDLIQLLAKNATKSMFSVAAAHAALKGHKELTEKLYFSGDVSDDSLNAILAMAVEGGFVEIILWAIEQGADTRSIPAGLIGRNFLKVTWVLPEKQKINRAQIGLYIYGTASFGTVEDIQDVFRTYPEAASFEKEIQIAFIGAIENQNPAGISFLEPKLELPNVNRSLYSKLLVSAARGNNEQLVLKYLPKASVVIPALLIIVANGNIELTKIVQKSRPRLALRSAPLYAAYSGSIDMVQHFISGTPTIEEVTLLAYGAAAGGNWDFLNEYLTTLEFSLEKDEYLEVLGQVAAEAILHSQLSLFNSFYDKLKDALETDELISVFDLREKASKLTHIPMSHIHESVVARFRHLFA